MQVRKYTHQMIKIEPSSNAFGCVATAKLSGFAKRLCQKLYLCGKMQLHEKSSSSIYLKPFHAKLFYIFCFHRSSSQTMRFARLLIGCGEITVVFGTEMEICRSLRHSNGFSRGVPHRLFPTHTAYK